MVKYYSQKPRFVPLEREVENVLDRYTHKWMPNSILYSCTNKAKDEYELKKQFQMFRSLSKEYCNKCYEHKCWC